MPGIILAHPLAMVDIGAVASLGQLLIGDTGQEGSAWGADLTGIGLSGA